MTWHNYFLRAVTIHYKQIHTIMIAVLYIITQLVAIYFIGRYGVKLMRSSTK